VTSVHKSGRLKEDGPASVIAVAYHVVDYVVHGWDFAASGGVGYELPADVLAVAPPLVSRCPTEGHSERIVPIRRVTLPRTSLTRRGVSEIPWTRLCFDRFRMKVLACPKPLVKTRRCEVMHARKCIRRFHRSPGRGEPKPRADCRVHRQFWGQDGLPTPILFMTLLMVTRRSRSVEPPSRPRMQCSPWGSRSRSAGRAARSRRPSQMQSVNEVCAAGSRRTTSRRVDPGYITGCRRS
jgi:hypothetical protein